MIEPGTGLFELAEPAERDRRAADVAELAPDSDALLETRRTELIHPVGIVKNAGQAERIGTTPCPSLREAQQPGGTLAPFANIAAQSPEPAELVGDLRADLATARLCLTPVECRPNVVVLQFEPGERVRLLGTAEASCLLDDQ